MTYTCIYKNVHMTTLVPIFSYRGVCALVGGVLLAQSGTRPTGHQEYPSLSKCTE